MYKTKGIFTKIGDVWLSSAPDLLVMVVFLIEYYIFDFICRHFVYEHFFLIKIVHFCTCIVLSIWLVHLQLIYGKHLEKK
jgi:hypothetical protein